MLVAIAMWALVTKTKLGMLIRAGAADRTMIYALGTNIRLLFTLVFGMGTALGALAGVLMAPILGANSGMGEQIIIVAFVVIVIGGIGSVRGCFIAALITGLIDALGRSFLDVILALFIPVNAAEAAAPAISSMLIYIFMTCILFSQATGPVRRTNSITRSANGNTGSGQSAKPPYCAHRFGDRIMCNCTHCGWPAGSALLHQSFRPADDMGDCRNQPQPDSRLWGHDQLWSRPVSWHRCIHRRNLFVLRHQ